MGFSSRARTAVATVMLGGLAAWAQVPGVARVETPKPIVASAHGTASTVITIQIDSGFHIQSNHPKLDYLIPTSLTFTPQGGVALKGEQWPAAKDRKFSFSPDPLAVFEGTVKVPVTLATGAAGSYTLHGTFHYQACNDQLCRPPVSEPFTLQIRVR